MTTLTDKILGLETKTPQVATQPNPGTPGPTPAVATANQATKPSVPLVSAFPKAELGDSGTRMIHGIITEEYNPQLQGIQGIKIYDDMRKSDGTVRAAMLVTTLPIRRAQWFINPVPSEDLAEAQQNKDIAGFVEHALFDWLEDMTWDDVIRQALLMCAFGVMLFEKVYTIKEHDGKEYVTLKKLAPRLPKSIMQWELPDRTFGIQQIRQDGIIAMIPGSKLLIFVNEREGDNWWGTSMLRAAYKHWYYKDNFYKIDAVAFERQGLGVPKITMPKGYTANDEKSAITAMQNLRANENAYLLLPPDYTAEFMNMGANTIRDPKEAIEHHNKEILQSVLAQFLELGATKSGSGSRALSQDHSDLFLKAEEAIANTIIAVFNKDLIPELVNLNFQDVKVYPVVDYSGITKADVAALGTAYSQLVTAGAITPTDDDQQYMRAAMGLPPRTQEDIDAANEEEPSIQDLEDHANIEDTNQPDPEGPDDNGGVDAAAEQAVPPKQTPAQNKKVSKAAKGKKTPAPAKASIKRFSDGKGFMSWRPLTMSEKKVNFKNIQDTMDNMENDFNSAAIDLLNSAKDDFMSAIHDAIDSGDQKAISDLEISFVAAYTALLQEAMQKAYSYGKNTANTEIGVKTPPDDPGSIANIGLMAQTIAEKTASDLEAKAKLAAANAIKNDATPLQAAGQIDQTLEDTIDTAVDNTEGIIISQSINTGRNDVFQSNSELIQSLQRSEILDEKTCDFCLSMDGRVITTDDEWADYDTFHDNCRGIWVAIMNDEQDAPDITGVPDDLASYYGGQPNALVQPKNPIVDGNSPAAYEVARRKADKANKQ